MVERPVIDPMRSFLLVAHVVERIDPGRAMPAAHLKVF
jgi:hypothetical protein